MVRQVANPTLLIVFLLVQAVCLTTFFLDESIHSILGSTHPAPIYFGPKDPQSILIIVALIALTAALLTRYRTISSDEFSIRFPIPLHMLLMFIEVVVVVIRISVADPASSSRVEAMREAYNHLPNNTRLLKVGTLLFYMTTMLLAARIALEIKQERATGVKSKSKMPFIWLLIITGCVFLLKDLAIGSRGSTINFIAFFLGGFCFIVPITLPKLYKKLLPITSIVIGLGIIISILTFVRANDVGLSLIYDTLLYKLSTNVGVAYSYLTDNLSVRSGYWLNGQRAYSDWKLVSDLTWSGGSLTKLSFFGSFEDFLRKFLFPDKSFRSEAIYFDVYGNMPFNTSSYLLKPIILGWFAPTFLVFVFVAFRLAGLLGRSFQFFSFCIVMHSVLLSFTAMPLIEIPMILILPSSLLFISCFKDRQ